MSKDDIQSYVDRANQMVIEDISRVTDTIYSQLEAAGNNKYPADLFAKYFLTYFSGQTPMGPDDQVIANWVNIAGSPSSEVDLIDAAGNTVAVVPPMIDTSNISGVKREDGKEFSDITAEANMRSHMSKTMAKNYLYEELDKKSDAIIDVDATKAKEEKWVKLMDYFDIPRPGSVEQVDGPVVEDTNRVDDELIYD